MYPGPTLKPLFYFMHTGRMASGFHDIERELASALQEALDESRMMSAWEERER